MPTWGTRRNDGDDRREHVTLLLIIGILAVWASIAGVVVAACVLGARADRDTRSGSRTVIRVAPAVTQASAARRSRLARV
jgi:hypothetical protein